MLRKLFRRLTYANVMSTIAVFGVLAGGTAYAANEWTGANIVDGSLTGADVYDNTISGNDITNNSVASADVKDQSLNTFDVSTFLGADIVDGSLTSADVAPGTFVEGRGQLLSNRIVFTPVQFRTLLAIPGLGELIASCGDGFAQITYRNTTSGPVDAWLDDDAAGIISAGQGSALVHKNNSVMLGTGNDPGPRRVASLKAASFQSGPGAPCGFQAQGTLWTSP